MKKEYCQSVLVYAELMMPCNMLTLTCLDEEENVVKIFQSVCFDTDVEYYDPDVPLIMGVREHETRVIRPENMLNKDEDPEEKAKIEETAKKLKAMFASFGNDENNETAETTDTQEEALV